MAQGGIQDDKVIIDNKCKAALQYANKNDKPLIHSIAHYDLGKIPEELRKHPLNLTEKLVISIGYSSCCFFQCSNIRPKKGCF